MKIIHNGDTKQEVWKDISDFIGIYQVSSLGRVKSLDRKYIVGSRWNKDRIIHFKGKMLTPASYHNNYLFVVLSCPSYKKQKMIHRLVAESFISNPENKREVNHKDGNKNNNMVKNLEWVTPSENMYHSYKMGLNYQRYKNCVSGIHPNCKRVIDILTREVYPSLRTLCEKKNLKYSSEANKINGHSRTKTIYRYI